MPEMPFVFEAVVVGVVGAVGAVDADILHM
jgi:hypothetical protein